MDQHASRRDLLLTSLMAALPAAGYRARPPVRSTPEQTIIKPPDALQWQTLPPFPPSSVDTCALAGQTTGAGALLHARALASGIYERAALSIRPTVIAWCCRASGGATAARISTLPPVCRFPPAATCGVSRLTPHYDGAIRSQKEPAVIAICGNGPVEFYSQRSLKSRRGGKCERERLSAPPRNTRRRAVRVADGRLLAHFNDRPNPKTARRMVVRCPAGARMRSGP